MTMMASRLAALCIFFFHSNEFGRSRAVYAFSVIHHHDRRVIPQAAAAAAANCNPSTSNDNRNTLANRIINEIGGTSTALSVARYGPQSPLSSPGPENDSNDSKEVRSGNESNSASSASSEWDASVKQQKEAFQRLIQEALEVTQGRDPATHLPRLLANNLELVVGLVGGQEGVEAINEILSDATARGGQNLHDRTLQIIETILSFSESFVEQAQEMDSHNKHLLGKIIKAMGSAKREVVDDNNTSNNVGAVWGGGPSIPDDNDDPRSREERLDAIMEQERDNFTPGFVRHLEGECDRIANAPQMTPESARLLELIRVIQARVLEEIGKGLGEAALVLGQLMGYESNDELLGVLEAGLTVRGRDFGVEMKQHTEEALDGFKKVPGGVDPELVDKVTLVDKRLQEFLDETNEFQ